MQKRLDTWLIRELMGLDPDMAEGTNFGFVVPLRSYSLLPVERIEVDKINWYKKKESYLRVCRLRGVYKSHLIQQFVNLYERVGVDDNRDEEHRHLFKLCAKHLFPEVE
jgi:hypothetical protein